MESIIRSSNGTSNIAFCAGGLVVGIIGEILFGMLSIMFGILISLFSVMAAIGFFIWIINYLTNKDMARRYSRTAAQQCRFYEVDNIFEYMVETYINGNHSTLRRLYHELNKEARKDFIGFLLVECPPQYHTEILQEIV